MFFSTANAVFFFATIPVGFNRMGYPKSPNPVGTSFPTGIGGIRGGWNILSVFQLEIGWNLSEKFVCSNAYQN